MAITSVGYAGTVDDVEWPLLTRYAGGATYNVAGASDYVATPGVGDRAVAISAGVAAGAGVVDTNDAPVTLLLPSVASGDRWDLIGLRRHWGTQTSSIVRVAGSSSKVLPSRPNTPGNEDVQPLWLVRVSAGQTSIQEYVDLRVWVADGGAYANDDLVRSYMSRVGTYLTVGNEQWLRRVDQLGSPEWVNLPDIPFATASGTSSVAVPAGQGRQVTITLPANRFAVAPNVFLTMGPTAAYLGDRAISVWSRSSTQVVVGVSNTSTVAVTVPFMWFAVQQSASAADG